MKNKEKLSIIILYVIIIVFVIGLITGIYFLTNSNNNNEKTHSDMNSEDMVDQTLKLTSSSLTDHFYDSHNEKNLSYHVATLNGDMAYSADYGCDTQEISMTFREYLSDQSMAILINGYPNKTFESLGCSNEDEAYLATQMAFWEVANRTGESKKSTEIFRVEKVTSKPENNESYLRITEVAKKLVELAETKPYSDVPTMHIGNADVTSTFVGEDTLIGPYTITLSDDSEIQAIKVSLVNAPASAKITDEKGTEKTILASGDTVYIRMNTSEEPTNFNIKFEANVNRKVGAIYEETNNTMQDYAKLTLVPIEMEKELTIEWSKITTLGRIELIVADSDNKPVVGSVFNLVDSNNNVIMEVKSGKDGIVDFYSVPVGDYTLTQISAPEGYEIKESSKKVTVTGGELSTVTFEN